jgi:undecaprenyl-diphosphatase
VGALRLVRTRLHDLRAALGIVVLAGAALAALLGVGFAWIAHRVRAGSTQAFDEGVLRWVAAHRIGWLESTMLELTFLGTGTVVVTIAGVAALFLALTRQRTAAALLLWSTIGAILLNNVLKAAFSRPRPELFTWGTHVRTTSFPSGHAMSAAAIYGTVAFLAARLARTRRARLAIHVVAALIIVVVAASRVYLGVHYPTDVAAGLLVGLAWAAFCTAALEAGQFLSGRRRRAGGAAADDAPAQPADSTRSKTRSK